jgi:lipid-A-disaccharide synthase
MVNLIAEEEVVPELVQHKFTAANVVAELSKILPDGPAREKMIQGLKSVCKKLHAPDNTQRPADRAAAIIQSMLPKS